MTAPITSFTTTDKVRACMGVTDNELSDNALLDMGLSLSVRLDLEEILDDPDALWAASNASGATKTDKQIGKYIELFCSWDGAYRALAALLAIPQQHNDGKASISRFAVKDQLESAQRRIQATAAEYRNRLRSLANNNAKSSVVTPAGLAKPSYDPVTGTTS